MGTIQQQNNAMFSDNVPQAQADTALSWRISKPSSKTTAKPNLLQPVRLWDTNTTFKNKMNERNNLLQRFKENTKMLDYSSKQTEQAQIMGGSNRDVCAEIVSSTAKCFYLENRQWSQIKEEIAQVDRRLKLRYTVQEGDSMGLTLLTVTIPKNCSGKRKAECGEKVKTILTDAIKRLESRRMFVRASKEACFRPEVIEVARINGITFWIPGKGKEAEPVMGTPAIMIAAPCHWTKQKAFQQAQQLTNQETDDIQIDDLIAPNPMEIVSETSSSFRTFWKAEVSFREDFSEDYQRKLMKSLIETMDQTSETQTGLRFEKNAEFVCRDENSILVTLVTHKGNECGLDTMESTFRSLEKPSFRVTETDVYIRHCSNFPRIECF